MKRTGHWFSTTAWVALLCFGVSCKTGTMWRTTSVPMSESGVESEDRFVRAHLRDGSLVVLSSYDFEDGVLSGTGRRYGASRALLAEGGFEVPAEDIAVLETADLELIQKAQAGVAIAGGIVLGLLLSGGIAVAAVIAVAGSCPTFYRDGVEGPVAEAFSHGIAQTFEHRDVDAIGTLESENGQFELELRNEFPETHYIRRLELQSARIPRGYDRVHRTDGGEAWAVRFLSGPKDCDGLGVGCAQALGDLDGIEASTPAHPGDLSTRSEVDLSFDGVVAEPGKRYGLAISGHRSMIGTWMLYRMFSLLGDEVGEFTADLDRDPLLAARVLGFARAMGRLDISIETEDGWTPIGQFSEVGPMATDTSLFPLPEGLLSESPRVRLQMAQGFFVLDAVRLVEMGPRAEMEVAAPVVTQAVGFDPKLAEAALAEPGRYLTTLGGQSARLRFDVGTGRRELFLDAEGFYHEWVRPDWKDGRSKDVAAFEAYLQRPTDAFRDFAPDYKAVEPWLEEAFWSATIREPL